jgi:electron transfer flavoprotein beta subunit
MNILVCIKQVPSVMKVRIDQQRWTLAREGAPNMINPFDLHAIEAALNLKEHCGGEVTVMTMGPKQSEEALREALAMGADRAVLLTDPAFSGADTLATSYSLARAIENLGSYDLIICGTQSTDSDTAQVGPQLAEDLQLPLVTYARKWHLEGDRLVIERVVDGFLEVLDCALPALITVSQKANTPRLPPFEEIERAFNEGELLRLSLKDIEVEPQKVGLSGSATRVTGIYEPEKKRNVEFLTGEPEEVVETIVRWLKERHFIE